MHPKSPADHDHAEFLATFCDQWFEALNSRDTQRMLDLTTEDIVWDDTTFWPTPARGHQELGKYLDTVWTLMPDVDFSEIERFYNPELDKAVVLWRMRGSGPPKLAPDKSYDYQGCDLFLEFRGSKLAHYQGAYELTEMLRQLEVLPPRDGMLGAAYLLSLSKRATAAPVKS